MIEKQEGIESVTIINGTNELMNNKEMSNSIDFLLNMRSYDMKRMREMETELRKISSANKIALIFECIILGGFFIAFVFTQLGII